MPKHSVPRWRVSVLPDVWIKRGLILEKQLVHLIDKALSRRGFLAGSGTLAAATILAGCSSSSGPAAVTTPTNPAPAAATLTDADYFNFALNFEYFGAEYYLRATTGSGLSSTDAGAGAGTVNGGTQVSFVTPAISNYANMFAQDELNHVRLLRSAIFNANVTPVSRPAIDYVAGFNAISAAAGLGPTFNPFDNENDFILGAFSFEDIDVTAYTGAAPLLTSAANLNSAAGVQAVEAYHAGAIRTIIAGSAVGAGASQTMLASAAAIQMVRSSLGGGNETTLSPTTVVNANPANAIGYARTTDQVLHIVYGMAGAGVASGGFFPNGINGNISVTTS